MRNLLRVVVRGILAGIVVTAGRLAVELSQLPIWAVAGIAFGGIFAVYVFEVARSFRQVRRQAVTQP